MTFVLDASIALAWCFADEAVPAVDVILDRLEDERAIAPAHWALEVANALRAAERRGRLDAREIPRLARFLGELPIELVPVDLGYAASELIDVARAHELSVYDAAYLALAAARGLPLATADERLGSAATRAQVERLP